MKFSTSNHSSSSSVVLFLSLGFQFANTVSAKSSIRGLQIGDVAVTATGVALPPPATTPEPDACVTDCGIGPWSTLHLQTSLSTGIDFDTAMGEYSFTDMELEMLDGSNSTSLIDEDDVPPGPPGSMIEPGSPAADGRPSGPSDSMSGPSDSKSGPSLDESPSGPSDSKSGPSGSMSGPSDSMSGPSDSMSGPSLDESPSGPSDEDGPGSPSGPSEEDGPGSPSGPSDEDGPGLPSGPSEEDGPGSPSGPSEEDGPGGPSDPSEEPPSGTGPSGSALLEETEKAP